MSVSDITTGGQGRDRIQPAPRVAGSTADLYPRVAAMQRLLEAASFTVVTARAATAIAPGSLSVLMQSPETPEGPGVAALVERRSEFLLRHLRSSPHPVCFQGEMALVLSGGCVDRLGDLVARGAVILAFPVQLGAMGNGYTLFFGVRTLANPELLIDVHRKSVVVLREALKLEFGSVPAFDNLNDREIECLQMVGDGLKSEAIGEKLNLSVHTVNAYLGSATNKLDAVNRIQAIAKAIRLGLIG